MEQKIYRERNRAWNREWKKRFGDGSVIEADEVAFGQGKTLTEELLKAQVSFDSGESNACKLSWEGDVDKP